MGPFLKPILQQISRREFLKLSGATLLGLFNLPLSLQGLRPGKLIDPQTVVLPLGRVTASKIDGFDRPSFSADIKKAYWQDLVLNITGVSLGDTESGHNRVWYLVNDESYVHSGDIQPVEIRLNQPRVDIPENGLLAEVTVPFTDAIWEIRLPDRIAYRLYYGTTHWISSSIQDENGQIWYRINDDKWKIKYYVRAAHLHIVAADEVAPLSAHLPWEAKRMEIRLPEQVVIAYENESPVFMARTATGARFREGDYTTPKGNFITNRKRPSRHMAAGDLADSNSYDLPGVPWVCYLMDNGISFHGTFWHNNFGRPRSHGCVNLTPQDARWVYRWTFPSARLDTVTLIEKNGTMVSIIDKPFGE
jgi:lipoprotein-anchoring transpeptidase ErfK/SrfK